MNATEAFEAIRAFEEHEHRDLARGLDRIHDAGRQIGSGSRIDDIRVIGDVLRWSTDTLAPHILWEESWLYPQIDTLTGTSWATRAARFDHGQIRGLASRLHRDEELAIEGLGIGAVHEIRAHLFAFEGVLRSHIDREEHLLLPVLAQGAVTRDGSVGERATT